MTTLTRQERVAALYRLAPLVRWEPPQEELFVAEIFAAMQGIDIYDAVWYHAANLAWSAAWRHGPHREPTAAEERAVRIWCLITADRIAEEWTGVTGA